MTELQKRMEQTSSDRNANGSLLDMEFSDLQTEFLIDDRMRRARVHGQHDKVHMGS